MLFMYNRELIYIVDFIRKS